MVTPHAWPFSISHRIWSQHGTWTPDRCSGPQAATLQTCDSRRFVERIAIFVCIMPDSQQCIETVIKPTFLSFLAGSARRSRLAWKQVTRRPLRQAAQALADASEAARIGDDARHVIGVQCHDHAATPMHGS